MKEPPLVKVKKTQHIFNILMKSNTYLIFCQAHSVMCEDNSGFFLVNINWVNKYKHAKKQLKKK